MSFGQNGYQQQQQQSNDDYIVAYVNERGDPIIWEDRNKALWAYNDRNEFIEVDQNGYPIQNNYPPQRPNNNYGNNYNDGYQDNRRLPSNRNERQNPNSNRGSVGGNKYGNISIGSNHSSYRSNRDDRNQRVEKPSYKPRNDRPIRDEVIEVKQEVVVEEAPKLISELGYTAEIGSEMLPYYDESIDELDISTDEEKKVYKFIIKRKG